MFGGSGSQLQHIITASIRLQTISGFRLTGGHWGNTLKTHRRHHNVYRHVSLGGAAPACCVNHTAVRLYAGNAWLCVNKQRWRIGEPPLQG